MRIATGSCCLAITCCVRAAGATTPTHEALGQLSAGIVGGTASNEAQNGAVVVMRGNFLDHCTGAVVAPRLILTARHCLFGPDPTETFYNTCELPQSTIDVHAWPAEDFGIYVGHAKPLDLPAARGVTIHVMDDLDICTNDVALLEVDADLDVEPLRLRLDSGPRVDEETLLVGWGWTAPDDPGLPTSRQQRSLTVLSLGGEYYAASERFIEQGAFAAGEGGCVGDDGAPLTSSETGAVIGIEQAVVNLADDLSADRIRNCLGGITIFQRLDDRAEWIRATFRKAGAAPWVEGKQRPAPLGMPCLDADECASGVCFRAGDARYCSTSCNDRPCADGMICVGADGERVCGFSAAQPFESAGSCALGSTRGRGFGGALAVTAAAALRRARRRGRRTHRTREEC